MYDLLIVISEQSKGNL